MTVSLAAQDAVVKLTETRQRTQREHAAILIALAKQAVVEDSSCIRSARIPAELLDAALLAEAIVPRVGTHKDHKGDLIRIMNICEAIEEGRNMSEANLDAVRKVSPLLADIAVARRNAARALLPIASGYLAAGAIEPAHEVATLCVQLHRTTADEVYAATGERAAAARFASTTKPFLERLRLRHEAIGRAKGWEFNGMAIRVPDADAENAALIATDRVNGDFAIETEVQFAATKGTLLLVVAWVDSKNYCGLEYRRVMGAGTIMLRLVHVAGGEHKDLVVAPATWRSSDEWFPLRVRVERGVMSTDLCTGPCSAPVPIDLAAGARCGLLRPGHGKRDLRKKVDEPIQLRNFLVRP